MTEILQRFNWVDILTGAIMARSLSIGMQRGVVVETFKLLGVFFSLLVALHYYITLAHILHFASGLGYVFTYASLWGIIVLDFKLIRDGVLLVLKVEAQSIFDKWGGFVLAFFRGLLICGLTVLLLRVSGGDYLKERTQQSISGPYFARLASGIYEGSFEGLINKFFPNEQINKQVLIIGHSEAEKK